MFNNTHNVTDILVNQTSSDIDSTDNKTWYDHYSEYEGFGKLLFLVPVILFGSFTVIAMLRYCSSKK